MICNTENANPVAVPVAVPGQTPGILDILTELREVQTECLELATGLRNLLNSTISREPTADGKMPGDMLSDVISLFQREQDLRTLLKDCFNSLRG